MLGRCATCAFAAALAGCGSGEGGPAPEWCDPPDPAYRVVSSTGPGRWGGDVRPVDLTELWRAGGLREGEHLWLPIGAAVGPHGMVAMADFRLREVALLSATGEWMSGVLPRGEGPGEVRGPLHATWDAEGTLHVVDESGAKVVRWSPDAGFLGERRIAFDVLAPLYQAGELWWLGLQPGTALLAEIGRAGRSGASEVRSAVVRQRFEGGPVDTLVALSIPALGAGPLAGSPAPGWPGVAAAVGADGRTALGSPSGAFAFSVLSADLSPHVFVCRDEPPLPLSPLESGAEWPESGDELHREALRSSARPPTPAALGRLLIDADGRIWAQRQRPPPAGTDAYPSTWGVAGAEHLVFAPDGAFLGRVTVPAGTWLQGARGETMVVFEMGTLGEVWVVAYRMEVGG